MELIRQAVPGVPLSRLRAVTFGSPPVVHSWQLRQPVLDRCAAILQSSGGAFALSFVHECGIVPRSLGSEYHNDILYNSSSLQSNPKLRESKRYFPLALPPHARYYFIHGGFHGRSLEIFEIPPELLTKILDLPMGFVDGVSAWQEAHRMTNYMTKLQRFCWTYLYGGMHGMAVLLLHHWKLLQLSLHIRSRPQLGLHIRSRPQLGLHIRSRPQLGLHIRSRPQLGLHIRSRKHPSNSGEMPCPAQTRQRTNRVSGSRVTSRRP